MTGEPCSQHCGYVSHGLDLSLHERYEHVPCPECGSKPVGCHAVTHEPDCPRLRRGYAYPDPVPPGRALTADDIDQAAGELAFEDDWEPCSHVHDDWCEDYQGFFVCSHTHCGNCGGCGCPGYCDDYQTYNLRPDETGAAG